MTYIATIGAIVGVIGTGYSIYSQNRAIDAANSAEPRPFVPIDIPTLARQALAADVVGFAASDEDFLRRAGPLVRARDYNVDEAGRQLGGALGRTTTAALDKSGLRSDLGGATEYQKALNLGKPVLSMEQRDRGYFSRLLGENPQRSAGLSGDDVTRLALANTNAQNAYNSQLFGNQIDRYNASIAQNTNNMGAAATGLAGLASLFPERPASPSNYLNPLYWNLQNTGPSYPPLSSYG